MVVLIYSQAKALYEMEILEVRGGDAARILFAIFSKLF
jgi:hypothetical protein